MFKKIFVIFFVYVAVCCSAFASSVRTSPNVITVDASGKKASVYVHQKPALLVIGPAKLFYDRCLPRSIEGYFDVYYVDILNKADRSNYEMDGNSAINDDNLDTYVDFLKDILKGLSLKKATIFGHSSNGILALKLSYKYPEYVSALILVGTTPFRGKEKADISERFFKEYAGKSRQNLYFIDQQELQAKSKPTYIDEYNSKRAFNFYNPFIDVAGNLWQGIDIDLELTKKYFSLVDSFDIRKEKKPFVVPTFLALGRYDYVCPYVLWDLRLDKARDQMYKEDFFEMYSDPLLTVKFFEKSAHFPMIEEEELFVGRLLEFLRQQNILDQE